MSDKMKERNSFNKKLLLFFGGVFFDRKKDFNSMSKMWQTNIKINIQLIFNKNGKLFLLDYISQN